VIGGLYSGRPGARKHFGALLVGYYAKSKLLFAGKVGTGYRYQDAGLVTWPSCVGFANRSLSSPPDLPSETRGPMGPGDHAGMMRQNSWVKPDLVLPGEIRRSGPADSEICGPRFFLGYREDKISP
jgi:hypothetical protein